MTGMEKLTKQDLFELIEQYCSDNDIKENECIATLFYCSDNLRGEEQAQQQCIMFHKEIYNP